MICAVPMPLSVPLTLAVIIAASWAMFWLLVWRWTQQRQWVELVGWTHVHGYNLRRAGESPVPEGLASALGRSDFRLLMMLDKPDSTFARVELPGVIGAGRATGCWNVLIRRLPASWPTSALRPVALAASLADLLPLSAMRAVSTDRFAIYSHERAAVLTLSKSQLLALTPPDVGLILAGGCLLLDFSTRAFDPLELSRMDALARQLAQRL